MDCRQVTRLIDSHAAGELPADKAAEVAAHVEGCASCARLLEEYKLAALMLRSSISGAPEADARFFRVLDRRLDDVDERFAGTPRNVLRWRIVAPVSAAAAALLLFAYYFFPQAPSRNIILVPGVEARNTGARTVAMQPRTYPLYVSRPDIYFRPVSAPSIEATDRLRNTLDTRTPRFYFPQQTWPIMGTNPSGSQSVTRVDYERLQDKVGQLESRIQALEGKARSSE